MKKPLEPAGAVIPFPRRPAGFTIRGGPAPRKGSLHSGRTAVGKLMADGSFLWSRRKQQNFIIVCLSHPRCRSGPRDPNIRPAGLSGKPRTLFLFPFPVPLRPASLFPVFQEVPVHSTPGITEVSCSARLRPVPSRGLGPLQQTPGHRGSTHSPVFLPWPAHEVALLPRRLRVLRARAGQAVPALQSRPRSGGARRSGGTRRPTALDRKSVV